MENTRIYSLENYQLQQDLTQSVLRCVENIHSIVDRESAWKIQFLATQLIVHAVNRVPEPIIHSIRGFLDTLNQNIQKPGLSEFRYCPELFDNIFKDLLTSTVYMTTRHKTFQLYHAVINPLSKFEIHPDFAQTALEKYIHDARHIGFS